MSTRVNKAVTTESKRYAKEPARQANSRAGSFVGNTQHNVAARFGAAVRRRRLELSLTQADLAEAADLDRSYISQVERGKESISLDRAERIAVALHCELRSLIE